MKIWDDASFIFQPFRGLLSEQACYLQFSNYRDAVENSGFQNRKSLTLVFNLDHQIHNQGLTIWSFQSADFRQRLSRRLPFFRDA